MDEDVAARVRAALIDARIVPAATDTTPESRSALAAALVVVLEVAARDLAATTEQGASWPEPVRTAVIDSMDRAVRVATAAKAPLLVAQEQSGTWRAPGMRSFEAYRAKKNREDMGAARRETSTARTLTELDGGLDALARGEITPSHAQRLQSVVDNVDPAVRAGLLTGPGAAQVRDLAKVHDPKLFERKVEQLAASAASPAEVQDAHEAIRARRYLRLLPGPQGVRLDGLLDPVAAHQLQLAIEAATPRPGPEDTRTLGQRNADALHTLAVTALAEGHLSPGTHVPTQVMITMTEQSFLAAQHHLATATHTRKNIRPDGGSPSATDPFPLVRTQDGPLLPPANLGKLLCGSTVGRLVVTAENVPLNVGRTQRTFKGHQRRAVEARDQHCAWPDCAQVARYCQVHHLDHWIADHGETDAHRAVLVCEFHHHELHTHDLDLTEIPRSIAALGRAPLLGDPDYEPPSYELTPRAKTADERRARLARRLRERAQERRSTA